MNNIKFGKGNKTMVILPGLTMIPISNNPDPVIDAYQLFMEDFTVYLFDIRDDIPSIYSIEDMANDLIIKFNELNLKDLYLFGVSLGGMISQYIALKYPKLIKKMLLVSNASKIDNDTQFWKILNEENNLEELLQEFYKAVYSDDFYESIKDGIKDYSKNIIYKQLINFRKCVKAIEEFDLSNKIHEIEVPTLIVASKLDRIFDYHNSIDMHEKINNSELYLYDAYSHAVYDEAQEFKIQMLEYFNN